MTEHQHIRKWETKTIASYFLRWFGMNSASYEYTTKSVPKEYPFRYAEILNRTLWIENWPMKNDTWLQLKTGNSTDEINLLHEALLFFMFLYFYYCQINILEFHVAVQWSNCIKV